MAHVPQTATISSVVFIMMIYDDVVECSLEVESIVERVAILE